MMLIAILLPALFALSALAINLAYIEQVGTDVQIAADAAVRAAGRTYAVTGDEAEALLAAQDAANRNPIAENVVLPITAADLDFGISDRSTSDSPYVFNHTGSGNAVRLTTRTLHNGSSDPIYPVFPFFGSGFEIRPLRTAYASDEAAAYPPNPASAPPGWDFGDAVPPNARWLDLIAAVQVFNNELTASPTEELLGLAVYNHQGQAIQNLSNDYSLTINSLTSISSNFEKGGTNIGSGIYYGKRVVTDPDHARDHASKVIVVLTDGVHNYGWNPVSSAASVANEGTTIFTITFSDEADQTLMQSVAAKCGGEHFHAATAAQLQEAFRQIARRLPTLLTQ
jgi:hypothetical protein